MFDFHQNSVADKMVVVEVANKIVDNMDYNAEVAKSKAHIVAEVVAHIADNMNYNVEAVESRAHIAAKVAHKTVKTDANMAHNEYHNCKFVQLIFVPFWNLKQGIYIMDTNTY